MITFLIITFVIVIISLFIMIVEVVSSPEGYEDNKGFHYGKEPNNGKND